MRTALIGLSVGLLGLTACGGGPPAGDTPAAEAETSVDIKTFMFAPERLNIPRSTTVTWTNGDAILHTVTSGTRDADAQGQPVDVVKDGRFDLQLDGKGRSGSYTFDEPGTYTYFCDRHPGMDAAVTVS